MRWFAVFGIALLLAGCSRETDPRLPIVVTTTMMESAVKDIGGEHVDVTVLIPAGNCPGHYDIRPGDVQSIRRSKALFVHGYQQFVPKLTESAGKLSPEVCEIATEGNWLIPEVYIEAGRQVTRFLCETDGANKADYERNFDSMKARITDVEAEIRRRIDDAGIRGLPVICSDQQSALLRWMGLDVVSEYGRPEEFTPSLVHGLVKTGRAAEVSLVVDNLQSGPTAGRQLAKEIGAAHITLSNFPGGLPNTPTWEACLRANVELVLDALSLERSKP